MTNSERTTTLVAPRYRTALLWHMPLWHALLGVMLGALLLGMTVSGARAHEPAGGVAAEATPVSTPLVSTPLVGTPSVSEPLLFATASQEVVQWRTPFTVEVALLTSAATPGEALAWREAFAALRPFEAPWEVLRAGDIEAHTARLTPGNEASGTAVELRRTFTVRLNEQGAASTLPMTVAVGEREATATPVSVMAYTLDQAFYDARRQVLPLVAANRGDAPRRAGSGFLVAPDALVTAYHVVVGMDRVHVTLPDGSTVTTRQVWVLDPARDVVILHVDPKRMERAGVVPLPLSTTGRLSTADSARNRGVSLTAGWRGDQQYTTEAVRYADLHLGHQLLVSANTIGPGDSGGPLLDTGGTVLGVVVSGRNTVGDAELLREDLCLAADLSPALAAFATREAPQPLRARLTMLEAAAPHAQLLRAVAALQTRPVRHSREAAPPARPLLADLLDAAARTDRDPAMLFLLGTTLEGIGDRAAAAAAFAQALEHAEGFFPAAYALGHYHLRRGEFAEAATQFARTAQHPAYRHLAALGLARSQVEQYDYQAAIEALKEVLRSDPTYAPALYLLAYAYLGLGDEATARTLHAYLRQDPRWAERIALHLRAQPLRPIALTEVGPR